MTRVGSGGKMAWVVACLLMTAMGQSVAEKLVVKPHSMKIGTNINGLRDWDTSFPLLDVYRSSRPIGSESGDGVELDAKGWIKKIQPGKVAAAPVLFDIEPGRLPAGDYHVRYEGDGDFEFFCAKVKQHNKKTGRAVIHISGKSSCGLYLKTLRSSPENPIRNIEIIMPGGVCASQPYKRVQKASQCTKGDYQSFEKHHRELIFNPDFIGYLRNFSVLRFMDAMETNSRDHIQRTWQDRPRLDDATWHIKGWPVEIMVKLANAAEADAWFPMPHAADDDYVRRFAKYVKANLDPGRKVYVEYSNEVWNGIFLQHGYAVEMGQKQELHPDKYAASWKFFSKRSVEIFRIWREVFSGKDQKRVVRVMATQAVNDFMTRELLTYQDAWKETDALAVAAYFGGDAGWKDIGRVMKMSDQQMVKYLKEEQLPKIFGEYQMNAKIATEFKMPLIAYEGGQHMVGVGPEVDNKELENKLIEMNRNNAMEELYLRMYQGWQKAGGGLYMNFNSPSQYSKWGSWGIKEYLNQPDAKAPKYRATIKMSERAAQNR